MAMNGYELHRAWFDYCFDNPDICKPSHTAIFTWAVEKANRMGWKEKFGFPTGEAMEVTGIKAKNTFYGAFNDLVKWGFIQVVTKSINQNTANIISLSGASKFKSAGKSALDSAVIQQMSQQQYGTDVSGGNIDKQVNQETNKQKNKRFKPPTPIEVSDYAKEKGVSNFDGELFCDHYDSNGWLVGGKTKMKDWKAAVRTWLKRGQNSFKGQQPQPATKPDGTPAIWDWRELPFKVNYESMEGLCNVVEEGDDWSTPRKWVMKHPTLGLMREDEMTDEQKKVSTRRIDAKKW